MLQDYEEKSYENTIETRGSNSVRYGRAPNATGKPQRNNRKFIERRKCYNCGKRGHLAKDCRIKHKEQRTEESNGVIHTAVLLLAYQEGSQMHISTEKSNNGSTFPCESKAEVRFTLDSGASDHMISNIQFLHNVKEIAPRKIILGDGTSGDAKLMGDLNLICTCMDIKINIRGTSVKLTNVLVVEGLKVNLISVTKLCRKGCSVIYKRHKCVVMQEQNKLMEGELREGIYVLRTQLNYGQAYVVNGQPNSSYTQEKERSSNQLLLSHHRLAHASNESIVNLEKKCIVDELDLTEKGIIKGYDCLACDKGKMQQLPMRLRKNRADKPGATIHSDICGLMSEKSLGGSKYYVSFIDEYSGHVTIVPILQKSEVTIRLEEYIAYVERNHGITVKQLQSDNGGEYIDAETTLRMKGIEISRSIPYCPIQNGISERMNRTIMEAARSMMKHAGLPKSFWAEA